MTSALGLPEVRVFRVEISVQTDYTGEVDDKIWISTLSQLALAHKTRSHYESRVSYDVKPHVTLTDVFSIS